MFQKLRETSLSLDQTERGLRCGQDGLFLGGDCALITRETLDETDLYRVRPLLEINSLLSAGYGAEIDFSANLLAINRVAGLLQKGELGLAQIVALQMRLPELSDDQSVDRLRKADRFLRFNPNHKPPGPGGGQFTSGSQSAASVSRESKSKPQKAYVKGAPRLSFRTTSGGPNQPTWGIKFELSRLSVLGGFIIQKNEAYIRTDQKITIAYAPFWEAFEVRAGQIHTVYVVAVKPDTPPDQRPVGGGDDYWEGVGPGTGHGVETDIGTARFYEGLTEQDLIRHGFARASVGPVGGENQYNTKNDPKFPIKNVSNTVVRTSVNRY